MWVKLLVWTAPVALLAVVAFLSLRAAPGPAPARPRPVTRPDPLVTDSAALMPEPAGGVHLLMTAAELQRARPGARRSARASTPALTYFEEPGPGRSRLLYGLDVGRDVLRRVQYAEPLAGVEAVAPRVRALVARHGPAAAVWDCPQLGPNPPTRRFSWRRGRAALTLHILLWRNSASATTYVTSADEAAASLAAARCVPVSEERLTQFPVAGRAALSGAADRAAD